MSTYFKQDFFDVINLWCKQIRGYSNWCLGSSCDSNKTPYFSTHSGKIKPLSQWYKSKAFSWTFFMYWTIFYLLQKHCLNHSIKGGGHLSYKIDFSASSEQMNQIRLKTIRKTTPFIYCYPKKTDRKIINDKWNCLLFISDHIIS